MIRFAAMMETIVETLSRSHRALFPVLFLMAEYMSISTYEETPKERRDARNSFGVKAIISAKPSGLKGAGDHKIETQITRTEIPTATKPEITALLQGRERRAKEAP